MQVLNCTHPAKLQTVPFFKEMPRVPVVAIRRVEVEGVAKEIFLLPREDNKLSKDKVVRCTRCGAEQNQ